MKKISIIILALTLIFAGCGSVEKEDLMTDLAEMDANNAEKKFENSGYVPIEMGVGTIYVKIEGNGTKDEEELEALVAESKDGVVFQFSTDVGSNSFYARKNVNNEDITMQYSIVVARGEATLTVSPIDSVEFDSVSVSYKYSEGELELISTDLNDEQKKIVDKHKKDAKAFFEKAFEELETVIK